MTNTQLAARVWHDIHAGLNRPAVMSLAKAILVVVVSTFLLNFAPIFIARLIDTTMSATGSGGSQLLVYAGLYLACRFAGQVLADFRWITVNPVIYQIAYKQCADIAADLAGGNGGRAGTRRSVAAIAEQAGVISKMNLSLVGILYSVVVVIFPALVEFIVVLAVVAYLVGPIAAAYVGIGLLILFMSVRFMKARELAETKHAFSFDNQVAGYYGEYLSNTALIREFAAGDFFRARLQANIDRSLDAHRVLFGTKTTRGVALSVATGVAYAAVVIWAVLGARDGVVSAGQFFLVIFYLDRVVQPMAAISTAVGGLQSSLVSMGIGYACLDQQLGDEPQEKLVPIASSVNLSAQYRFHLADGALSLGAPGVVFLAGASGAGKSTCLRWIYDSMQARQAADSWGAIHYLAADPLLVGGSVFDNIGLGSPQFDLAAVTAVWDRWHSEFGNRRIALDESVERLSAGERQYLAICRSLLRRPAMLILDEATNSIDAVAERKVMALIARCLPQCALLVVSHRERPITPDVVVSLRQGGLVSVEIAESERAPA
ncbi:ATP-binding cassette domain-containing protein [Pigmentiphaga aceris]|nr:ABC transporter ATP-binding protein [Pigmentiphaga aceris]